MARKLAMLAAGLSMAFGGTAAQAASLEDLFSVRGYATLGVVHSDEDQADFTNSLAQPEGAGASREFSFDVDSKFGVQLDINITSRLSAVVQLISESNHNNSWNGDINKEYQPSLEWANLSYRITDNLVVRGGRVVLPFLMVSEYRKVGFANHWLRAPIEVYGQVPFTSSDGGDVTYRSSIGKAANTVRVHYGVQSLRTFFTAQTESWGINDTLEIGAWTLRGAYMDLSFTTPGDGFVPLVSTFAGIASSLPSDIGLNAAAQALRLQNTYDPTLGQQLEAFDVAATYDPGQWFAMAELLRQRSNGFLGETTAGYVSGGYRWTKLTPYATYARVDKKQRNEAGIPLAGLPPQLAGLGAAINGIFTGLVNTDSSQQTLSLGLRWDFANKFALKGQYDYIDLDRGSTGLLSNQQPGFVPDGNLNVISIAVDYVF